MTEISHSTNTALKEWSVAIDALDQGLQILILRKGGIHRDDKDFRMIKSEFLLLPTFEHQAIDLLKPKYRSKINNLTYNPKANHCLLNTYTSPRDNRQSRMQSSA